jgi:DNA-binding IclR family transcriptional regulator
MNSTPPSGKAPAVPRSATSAVDKALDLVEAIARADRPLRRSEAAESAGMHRATAYRVLVDLVRRGWVLRTGEHYLPGTAILSLSQAAASHSLAALGRPALEHLVEQTGLMANLQVLESDHARVIDVVRPPRLEMISDLRGSLLPVHRFAGPLALVAQLEPEARKPYLAVASAAGHPVKELLADLETVRRTGFALERGRHDKVIASMSKAVAAPMCAVTIVGPDAEFSPARLPGLRRALAEAAERLETLLNGAPR